MPDIIKCKDCKYLEKWRTPERSEQFSYLYVCGKYVISNPSPDDYCSKAEIKEVSREDKLIDLANAIESNDSGYWTNKRISSALRNI